MVIRLVTGVRTLYVGVSRVFGVWDLFIWICLVCGLLDCRTMYTLVCLVFGVQCPLWGVCLLSALLDLVLGIYRVSEVDDLT